MSDTKVIIITDLLDTKARKEKELKYYEDQLKELEQRMYWLKREIALTNSIIDMIHREKMIDIKEFAQKKDD